MRRSALAAASTSIALLLLSGCTAASSVDSTPTSVATPDAASPIPPQPAPDVSVIGPGEKPPLLLDGDCGLVISAEELSEIVGYEVSEITLRDPRWTRTLDNVGGIRCEWSGGNFSVISLRALDGADASAHKHSGLDGCDWYCSWLWESERLSVSGWLDDAQSRGRDGMDAVGEAIGKLIDARVDDEPFAWRRDTDGWWEPTDCGDFADALGRILDGDVRGSAVGYMDPPGLSTILADRASNLVSCTFGVGDALFAHATFVSGDAWAYPYYTERDGAIPVEVAVPGMRAYRLPNAAAHVSGDMFELTDGINTSWMEISASSPWPMDDIAQAFAQLASDRPS